VPELALDHLKRVLDLGTHAGLQAFEFVDQLMRAPGLVQRGALARTHGHMPDHAVSRIGALVGTLVAGVGKDLSLLVMQQRVCLDHVVDIARTTAHRVNQARLGSYTDVRLHAGLPLVALLGLVHLTVALTAGVLGRTRRGDQRGVHCVVP
jgi:hypothetical protein